MEKVFMSASIITAIVLCIVGILKLPFKDMKDKHPKWYKALFTIISFVLGIGLAVANQVYILCDEILSIDFAILICIVIAGVFFGYGGVYEGLGFKELVKKIILNVKKARTLTKNQKALDYLNNIEDIEYAIQFLEEKKKTQEADISQKEV